MKTIPVNQHKRAFPISCQAIIQGDVTTFTNPLTGQEINRGDGKYLWKLSDKMYCPFFVLVRETSVLNTPKRTTAKMPKKSFLKTYPLNS